MSLIQIGGTIAANSSSQSLLEKVKGRANTAENPTAALIYVINKCHLKCDHCYESEASHPTHHQLSLEEYDRIFDELSAMGVLWLTFSGGEVFLRRDFLDIVALARQKRFDVTVYSSGTLINEKKADRLAELKVSRIELSIYSHDAALHDEFTKTPRSHERTLRAVRLLKERGLNTVLKTNVLSFNKDHLIEFKEMAEKIGVDYSFDPAINPRTDGDTAPLKYAVSPEEISRVLAVPELQMSFTEDRAEQICSGEGHFGNPDDSLCGAARATMAIGADGGVYPCASFSIHGGSLKEHSLEEIWHHSKLLNDVRHTTMKDLTGCSSCDVKSACIPCQAYAYIENEDRLGCNSGSLLAATGKMLHAQETLSKKTIN
jgi:radical SAM protein with 4Fe4S-binding SPASM domain